MLKLENAATENPAPSKIQGRKLQSFTFLVFLFFPHFRRSLGEMGDLFGVCMQHIAGFWRFQLATPTSPQWESFNQKFLSFLVRLAHIHYADANIVCYHRHVFNISIMSNVAKKLVLENAIFIRFYSAQTPLVKFVVYSLWPVVRLRTSHRTNLKKTKPNKYCSLSLWRQTVHLMFERVNAAEIIALYYDSLADSTTLNSYL